MKFLQSQQLKKRKLQKVSDFILILNKWQTLEFIINRRGYHFLDWLVSAVCKCSTVFLHFKLLVIVCQQLNWLEKLPRRRYLNNLIFFLVFFFFLPGPTNDQPRAQTRDRKKKKMSDEEIHARLRKFLKMFQWSLLRCIIGRFLESTRVIM